jgi:hypothetical protein
VRFFPLIHTCDAWDFQLSEGPLRVSSIAQFQMGAIGAAAPIGFTMEELKDLETHSCGGAAQSTYAFLCYLLEI